MGILSTLVYFTLHSTWLWVFALLVAIYYIHMRSQIGFFDDSIQRTDHKTFIITGAESGIGKTTTDLIASRGGRVIMACKNTALGEATKKQIAARRPNENLEEKIEVMHLDLSSLESVRKFAEEIHQSVDRLDVLINNASISCAPSTKTADGLNTIMQENHFGPFLLTNLLLDLLKSSTPSRVVFVSSITHHFHKFDVEDINNEKESVPACRLFFNSKLANIITAKYFARILKGTGVSVNTVHPGMVQPDPSINNSGCSGIVGTLFSLWVKIFGKTLMEGAMTSVYAAASHKLDYVTGEHFSDCKISNCVAKITKDEILQEKLFEKSAQLVKLKNEERFI